MLPAAALPLKLTNLAPPATMPCMQHFSEEHAQWAACRAAVNAAHPATRAPEQAAHRGVQAEREPEHVPAAGLEAEEAALGQWQQLAGREDTEDEVNFDAGIQRLDEWLASHGVHADVGAAGTPAGGIGQLPQGVGREEEQAAQEQWPPAAPGMLGGGCGGPGAGLWGPDAAAKESQVEEQNMQRDSGGQGPGFSWTSRLRFDKGVSKLQVRHSWRAAEAQPM